MERDTSYAEFLCSCRHEIPSLATRRRPTKSFHCAAGLQYSWFEDVVGTLWEVDDAVAKHVVEAFYESTFKHLKDVVVMDFTKAAQTLERATCSEKKMRLERRIGFIHIVIDYGFCIPFYVTYIGI
ncbi:hypothetical protein F4604DRAFT_1678491 [Suillus subluteus]|nr:hypothetical protein F4604DRAFT_1678491 [Suillus subluteus]